MNTLTYHIVRETIADIPKTHAIENGEKFAAAVTQQYNLHMTTEHLVPLLQRAYRLWECYHPERFEYEGNNFWPKYYDDELVFSGICSRLLQRRIDRTPELQLEDWGDYPIQLTNPNPQQVKEHYPDEFAQALKYQHRHAATYNQIFKYLNQQFGANIPIENIARAVIIEIKKNPILGLPLFM